MADIVLVDSIRHSYGDRLALADVSFQVQAGSCFGLLGPNGGGKTTLFRILTTLLRPMAGRALIEGFDVVTQRNRVRSRFGVVFQSPSLDPHLTVAENLMHHGHLHGLRGRSLAAAIRDSLERLGVADRSPDLVKTLSGGLRRRVEIAACMLHEPAVLILDEPSTGLDPAARRDLWDHLESLRRSRGVTILLTTHFLEEADRCDQLAILDRGRLMALGGPTELKARIGGDCLTIDAADAHQLSEKIAEQFDCHPGVVGGEVRIETSAGYTLVGELMHAFGPLIRSVTLGKPTLEDVFMHETGRRFDSEEA